MRMRTLFAVAAMVVAVLLGSASVVLAAPVPWDSVDLVVHDDNGKQLLMVAGTVPTETALPAEVELAVPTGLELQWAGEILGGDAANDPSVTYKVTKSGSSDIYRFTLTKSRTAQIELAMPGAVRVDGSNYAASLLWTPSQDVREVKMGFRIPANAQIVTPVEGAAEAPGPTGYDYYRSTIANAKAGTPLSFAFTFTIPAMASGATGGSASGGDSAAVVVIGVLVVIVGGLAFAVARKMRGGAATSPSARPSGARTAATPSKGSAAGNRTSPLSPATKRGDDTSSAPRAKGSKRGWILTGVIVALIIGAFLAIQSSQKPQQQGDVISRTFSSANPCTSTVVPLAVSAGSDMTDAAEKLFGVLQTLPSITTAKIYKDEPRIEVGYCESTLKPGQVEEALTATGLVAQ